MDDRNNDFDFDFMPIGQAIKRARTAQGMTREQLSRIVDYDPRHLQAIENEGQYPSLELFIQLVTIFNVSVDEYIFPKKEVEKSSVRRRLDAHASSALRLSFSDCCFAMVSFSFLIVIFSCEIISLSSESCVSLLLRAIFYSLFYCHNYTIKSIKKLVKSMVSGCLYGFWLFNVKT